mgnify:CR=1 FL=1
MERLNGLEDTINKNQLLFAINQGAVYADIRIEHAKVISEMGLDGYAVGGLAVGETHEEMYHILEETIPFLPKDKPVYLMGGQAFYKFLILQHAFQFSFLVNGKFSAFKRPPTYWKAWKGAWISLTAYTLPETGATGISTPITKGCAAHRDASPASPSP